jgi:hypothetical protein
MSDFRTAWLGLRIGCIVLVLWVILSFDVSKVNIDWRACIVVPGFVCAAVYFWLSAMRRRVDVDWSDPFSIGRPFWPMMRYPVRYWLVVGISVALGGSIRFAKDYLTNSSGTAFAALFAFMGLATLLAVAPHAVSRRQQGQR